MFPKKRQCEITYIQENLIIVRGAKYHSNDHELQEIKKQYKSIIKILNKMANEIEDLTAEVSETKGIMLSAKTLIEGFAAALEAAGTDKVKLKALKDDLNAGSEDLAAALTANPLPGEVVTPAEPPVA
jgi:chromosome segregation ATPase